MNNISDFIIEDGELIKYVGSGGDVVIPEGVTKIAMSVFSGYTNLQSVILPSNGVDIDLCVFTNCTGLREIIIPTGSWIGAAAFSGCTSLERVIIQDGMLAIGRHVFQNCSNLQYIQIPMSVEGINSQAFSGCNNVRTIIGSEKLYAKVFSNGSIISYLLGDYTLEDSLLKHVNNYK